MKPLHPHFKTTDAFNHLWKWLFLRKYSLLNYDNYYIHLFYSILQHIHCVTIESSLRVCLCSLDWSDKAWLGSIIYFCFSSIHVISVYFSVPLHCSKEIPLCFAAKFTLRLSDICKFNVRNVCFFELAFVEKPSYRNSFTCLCQ